MAFRFLPEKSNNRTLWRETYPCHEVCGNPPGRHNREHRRCARVDLPIVQWSEGECASMWLGLPPDFSGEGVDPFWNQPHENIEEGCPGAWYRTAFAESLRPYLPNGDITSPLVTSTTPPLILEALQWYHTCLHKLKEEEARLWH